jgi:hypothetical protein
VLRSGFCGGQNVGFRYAAPVNVQKNFAAFTSFAQRQLPEPEPEPLQCSAVQWQWQWLLPLPAQRQLQLQLKRLLK